MRVKEKINKLVVMVMIMLSFSMVIPNYSQAIDSKLGGPFQAFVCFFADAIENGLQMFFIGDKAAKGDGKKLQLNIKYSIATIVGNKIPMFNVNFFGDGQDGEPTVKDDDIEEMIKITKKIKEKGKEHIEMCNYATENNDIHSTASKIQFIQNMSDLYIASTIDNEDYGITYKSGIEKMINTYNLPEVWSKVHGRR